MLDSLFKKSLLDVNSISASSVKVSWPLLTCSNSKAINIGCLDVTKVRYLVI